MKKAIVAMSGGVDSSVAAYLINKAGYETEGVTMRLFGADFAESGMPCSSDENVADASKVAERLGIPFTACDFSGNFREIVIENFVASYENGSTPNPCVVCNRYLKFGQLFEYGKESGAEYIATGHYARIEYNGESGRYMLRKASDLSKDQTYVLYSLTQDQLAGTLFPLGGLTKQEVREIAHELGFENAERKESQDICFIPGGDYSGFIERYRGRSYPAGDFVDLDGNVLGRHKGIINYTIGQRKGLGLALKKPAYVLKLDIENNRVILGDDSDLFTRELTASNFNWVSIAPPDPEDQSPLKANARIRYRHKEAPALVYPQADGTVRIVFDDPQRAITRGQSVVLYDAETSEYVLGGGIIV